MEHPFGLAACAATALLAAGCCFTAQGGATPASGPITSLAPGFTPDPILLSGTAGGPTAAPSLDARCTGWVSTTASHTLEVTAPIPLLRVMAHMDIDDGDATLVVRLADGTYVCNDDADALDPIVELTNLPAGEHHVFVGIRSETATAPYRLALTSSPALRPSAL